MAESRGSLNIKAADTSILIRARLTNSAGAIITSGTTSLYIGHFVPTTGAFETLDFNDNTFKTTACTTPTVAMTHRTLNDAGVNTGVWTYRVTGADLSAHVVGDKYVAYVKHANLVESIAIEYQYGAGEGDDTPQTGNAFPLLPAALVGGRMDSSLGAVENVTTVDGQALIRAIRIALSALAGTSSGSPGAPVHNAADGSKARITAVVDSNGNRTSVVLDGT